MRRSPRRAAAMVLALGLAAIASGRGVAGAERSSGTAVPAFVRFGWVSPPPESTTDAHVAEMAEAGLDVMLPTQGDPGDLDVNRHRMDLAAAHGMRCLVFDARFEAFLRWRVDSPEGAARLDSIVADYRDHPGMFGYYLGDEPRPPWTLLHDLATALRARDPAHPAWNNLLGRGSWPDTATWYGYVRGYLDSVPAAVLCADHYEFRVEGDRGQFFEHAAGMRALADAHGIPFWSVVLLTPHRGYREVTPGMLRWQVANLLAYGCRGIGYFTWWTPAPDTFYQWHDGVIRRDGTRTPMYDVVAALDRDAGAVGTRLAAMRWVSTQCTAPVPSGADAFRGDDWLRDVAGRATLGRFVDAAGDPYVVVVNRDSLARRTLTVRLLGVAAVSRLDAASGAWLPAALGALGPAGERTLALTLDPGDFALLRLEGTRGEVVARIGPRVAVGATPAHGRTTLTLTRLDAGAILELFDARGRRVREWRPEPGDGAVGWDGTRADGSDAGPGVYLVRVRDRRGEAVARLVWLGR